MWVPVVAGPSTWLRQSSEDSNRRLIYNTWRTNRIHAWTLRAGVFRRHCHEQTCGALMSRVLTLDRRKFSGVIKIDVGLHNATRTCRIYGWSLRAELHRCLRHRVDMWGLHIKARRFFGVNKTVDVDYSLSVSLCFVPLSEQLSSRRRPGIGERTCRWTPRWPPTSSSTAAEPWPWTVSESI